MSQDDLQEEAGILALACAAIGAELAQGRLAVAADAHRKLTAVLKKFSALEEMAKPAANGHDKPAIAPVTPS